MLYHFSDTNIFKEKNWNHREKFHVMTNAKNTAKGKKHS